MMPIPSKNKKSSKSAKTDVDEAKPEDKAEKESIPSPKSKKEKEEKTSEPTKEKEAAPVKPKGSKRNVWSDDMKGQPVNGSSFDEFCSILKSIFPDETFDEKYKEDYDRYVKLDLDWSLALRKIKNYIKERKKVTGTVHAVCFGIDDMAALEYDNDGNITGKKEPWSVWSPAYLPNEKHWTRLQLKKKTNYERIGFKLFTTGDIQLEDSDTKSGYHNSFIKKMENYGKVDLTPILKEWWIPPEYVTDVAFNKDDKDAKVKRPRPVLVLYGKIGTFFLLQVTDKDGEQTDEFPYAKTLDDSGHKNPCFKFTLSNPDSFDPTDRGNFVIFQADQFYSRYTFNVEGWTEKYAENLNKLGDPDDILNEMKETFGSANDIYVFVVCSPAYISEKKGHRNYNAIYVEETDYRVDKDGIPPFDEFMKKFDGRQLYGSGNLAVAEKSKSDVDKTEKATDELAQRREMKEKIANGLKRLGSDASLESLIAGGFVAKEQVANSDDRKRIDAMVISVRKKMDGGDAKAKDKDEEKSEPEKSPEKAPSKEKSNPDAPTEMTEDELKEIDGYIKEIEKALIAGEMEADEIELELRSTVKKYGDSKADWFIKNQLAKVVNAVKDGLTDDKEKPAEAPAKSEKMPSSTDAIIAKIDSANPNYDKLVSIVNYINANDTGDGVAIADICESIGAEVIDGKNLIKELEQEVLLYKVTPRKFSLYLK